MIAGRRFVVFRVKMVLLVLILLLFEFVCEHGIRLLVLNRCDSVAVGSWGSI
jgi:hypothetical protein